MKIGFKSFNQIISYLFLKLSNLPMPGHWRWKILKHAGIKFRIPETGKHFVYIGENVCWYSAYPEEIEIGNNCHITTGCVLLTHSLSVNSQGLVTWRRGHIKIEDNVFIGAKSIITKPVTIGNGSVIGAGSVVTKDIPPHEVWGGVPAKFIKKLN